MLTEGTGEKSLRDAGILQNVRMNVNLEVECNKIKGNIMNIGNIDLKDIKLNIIGSGDYQTIEDVGDINKGEVLHVDETFTPSTVGFVKKVIVVPSIDYNGEIIAASSVAVEQNLKDVRDRGNLNLVSSHLWDIGSGSIDIFYQNGATSENSRECGVGPYGDKAILWKGGNDAASNADGGWNTATFSIDHTKKYRVSVWIKKTNSNDGTTYLGLYTPVNHLDGTPQSNPYFFCGDLPSLDKWYLVVGYIYGSGDNPTNSEGGIWDGETGEKVRSWAYPGGQCNSDYKFSTSSTSQRHRAYLYYDITTADRQYFWDPRFEEIDGNEPTIEDLLSRGPN
jgi:hypothetical protein